MKDTRRALRRHHRQRMIARIMNSYTIASYPPEEHLQQALRRYKNRKKCSCSMCGNQRKRYGPNIQELRMNQRVADCVEDYLKP